MMAAHCAESMPVNVQVITLSLLGESGGENDRLKSILTTRSSAVLLSSRRAVCRLPRKHYASLLAFAVLSCNTLARSLPLPVMG